MTSRVSLALLGAVLGVCLCPATLAAEAMETGAAPVAVHGRTLATANPRVLQQARELLASKRSEEAYQLLAPYEYEWAGDRDFDYLLGAAAVDSGRASEAVLSLQRSLATDPAYSAARMELARAYYNLGDYDYARAEFNQLLSEQPPDYARRVIDNYLLAIDKRRSTTTANFQYFVEFDVGYDTNANGSTSDDTFLGFTLDDNNVEQDSFFYGFSHGGIWSNPLTPRLTNYNQFGFNHRRNFSADFVNSDRLALATSLVWRQANTTLNAGLAASLNFLDSSFVPFTGDKNSNSLTLDLGARQVLGDRWLAGFDLRTGLVRYDEIEVRDVDQTIYALTVEHLWPGPNQARFGLTLIGGNEDEKESGSPFGRDQTGVRLTSSWLLSPIARSYLYLGSLKSDYDGQFFGEDREDTQTTAGWYLIWRVFPSQNWALVPRLTYTDNSSDIELFEYDRAELGLSIRWLSD